MLYQPTVSKSGELIDEAIQKSSRDNRHVLIIAGITASIFHLVFLGYWPIDMMDKSSASHSLKVILRKLPVQTPPAILVQEQTPVTITAETVSDSVPDPVKPAPSQEAEVSNTGSASVASPIADGFDLYNRAIKVIRDGSLPKSAVYKSFSTRDFPQREEADPFHPVQYLPIMISQPRMVQVQDVNGYTTILRTNGFGKSWCVQERGFEGDVNPPLWYLIPAATCGHLLE
jgi:hypothetical protein